MKTETTTNPKTMGADLMLLSPDSVAAKCAELNIPATGDKFKMIDRILIATFGLDTVKKAFARR